MVYAVPAQGLVTAEGEGRIEGGGAGLYIYRIFFWGGGGRNCRRLSLILRKFLMFLKSKLV